MNVKFDKALLWLLPYLYLVSVLYYWGYWGSLGGDAVNYYPVSDFVKGIVNPIINTIVYMLIVSILVAVAFYFKEVKYGWIALIATLLALVGFMVLLGHNATKGEVSLEEPTFIRWWRTGLSVVGALIAIAIENRLKDNKKYGAFEYAVRFTCIGFLSLFPFQAHVDGKLQAWRILTNQDYDYTMVDSVAAPRGVYKYLGKAGDHHFLLTMDNNERAIIPSDKLIPLIIGHYSITDEASKQRLAIYKQRYSLPLRADSVKSSKANKKPHH